MKTVTFLAACSLLASCSLFESEEPARGLRVLWRTETSAWGYGTPGLFGDKVIASFEDQRLRAFRLGDGALVWTGASAGRNLHPREVYVSADSVAIVTAATEVLGYSASDGSIRWRMSLPPDSSIDLTRGGSVERGELSLDASRTRIAVAAWGSKATVLRTKDGGQLWTWNASVPNTFRHGANGTLWCGNVVFISLWQYLEEKGSRTRHSIAALNASTGQELWRTALPFESFLVSANGQMSCDAEHVYATTMGGPLWAVTRSTGAVAWRADRSRGYLNNAGPLLANGVIYADDGINERIIARRAGDGTVLWETLIQQVPNYSIRGGNALLWISPGQKLHILDAKSGKQLFAETPGSWSALWPPLLLDERTAIVTTGNGVTMVRVH